MSLSKALVGVVLACGVLLISGCEPAGPKTNPVSGKITIGGQPARDVTVNFIPVEGIGETASGPVTNGTYELFTGVSGKKGAVAGKYKVTLSQLQGSIADPQAMMKVSADGSAPPATVLSFPAEYGDADKTPLEKEVKAGPNDIPLDIPAPGSAPAGESK